MSRLEEKLLENKCLREHEEFVGFISPLLKKLFGSCNRTHRKDALSNLALASWKDGKLSTTRGKLENWHRTEYADWSNSRKALINLDLPSDKLGWLSFDFDGMHYEMTGETLRQSLFAILELLKCDSGRYRDLSWVGETDDFGIILEYNINQDNEFEICHGGI